MRLRHILQFFYIVLVPASDKEENALEIAKTCSDRYCVVKTRDIALLYAY